MYLNYKGKVKDKGDKYLNIFTAKKRSEFGHFVFLLTEVLYNDVNVSPSTFSNAYPSISDVIIGPLRIFGTTFNGNIIFAFLCLITSFVILFSFNSLDSFLKYLYLYKKIS